jgi:hypothetical protein
MKTAVEWFEKIRQGQKVQPFDDYEWEIAFNHAKEMEKNQIIDAFKQGVEYWNGDDWKLIDIEQYYNETFKSE